MSTTNNHTVNISSRWYRNKVWDIETMTIDLPVSLANMVEAGQLEHAVAFRNVRVKDGCCIELHGCCSSRDDARQRVMRAARAFRVFGVAGLRAATKAERDEMERRLEGLPGQRVNSASWISIASGAWVFCRLHTRPGKRCARHVGTRQHRGAPRSRVGERMAAWVTIPHLFCGDQETAAALAASLGEIHADGPVKWTGTSQPYIKLVKRSRASAIMLEHHQEVGPILAALCVSRLPQSAAKDVRAVRRVLRDRLERVCSGAEPVLIYGSDCTAKAIGDQAGQIAATDRVVSIWRPPAASVMQRWWRCDVRGHGLVGRAARATNAAPGRVGCVASPSNRSRPLPAFLWLMVSAAAPMVEASGHFVMHGGRSVTAIG